MSQRQNVNLLIVCILLICSAAMQAQEPTETDRSEFEDWMGDYLLDAGLIQSYCVKYKVIAHEAIHEQVENIETS